MSSIKVTRRSDDGLSERLWTFEFREVGYSGEHAFLFSSYQEMVRKTRRHKIWDSVYYWSAYAPRSGHFEKDAALPDRAIPSAVIFREAFDAFLSGIRVVLKKGYNIREPGSSWRSKCEEREVEVGTISQFVLMDDAFLRTALEEGQAALNAKLAEGS